MNKQFKTPKFLKDAIKKLEKKEQEEWKEYQKTHTEAEIFYAQMYKDLWEVQMNLNMIKVKYGLDLQINFGDKKYYA